MLAALSEAIGRLDFAAFQWLRTLHSGLLDPVMAGLSDIGRGNAIWGFLALLIGFLHPLSMARGSPRPVRYRPDVSHHRLRCEAVLQSRAAVRDLRRVSRLRIQADDTVVSVGACGWRNRRHVRPRSPRPRRARHFLDSRGAHRLLARVPRRALPCRRASAGALLGLAVGKFVVGGTKWRFAECSRSHRSSDRRIE